MVWTMSDLAVTVTAITVVIRTECVMARRRVITEIGSAKTILPALRDMTTDETALIKTEHARMIGVVTVVALVDAIEMRLATDFITETAPVDVTSLVKDTALLIETDPDPVTETILLNTAPDGIWPSASLPKASKPSILGDGSRGRRARPRRRHYS